jgi:hypothetical protein
MMFEIYIYIYIYIVNKLEEFIENQLPRISNV